MEFANPKILWLLVVVPLWIAYYVWRSLQGGASLVISSADSLRSAPRTLRYYLRHLPAVLRAIALALIIIASARPQSVEHETPPADGADSSAECVVPSVTSRPKR